MKKIVVFVLIAVMVMAFAFTGCTSEKPMAEAEKEEPAAKEEAAEPAEDKIVIGVAMIDLVNPFYVNMVEAGNDAAEDYGVEVIWKSADGSLENEIALIENFVEQGVDCILIDPIDKVAVAPAIEKAGEAGIPVVTMGNFVDTPYNVNTLYNDYNDTKRIAEILAKHIGEEGDVALIFGSDGNFASDERKRGFIDGMAQFPGINVIAQPSNWDAATGLAAAQDILANNPDLKGLHCVSDGVSLSVMQALKGTDVVMTSYDGNVEGSEQVETGAFVLDLLTGSKRVGYWNVKVGVQLAKGEKLDQKQYLSSYFIMTDETKAKVEGWGLADGIKIVDPANGIRLFDDYRSDLGPGSDS